MGAHYTLYIMQLVWLFHVTYFWEVEKEGDEKTGEKKGEETKWGERRRVEKGKRGDEGRGGEKKEEVMKKGTGNKVNNLKNIP
jgi:hypothetical protein